MFYEFVKRINYSIVKSGALSAVERNRPSVTERNASSLTQMRDKLTLCVNLQINIVSTETLKSTSYTPASTLCEYF